MDAAGPTYYRHDLALVHHLGFGSHADACAPGVLALLEPVRERGGLVVELGCGSGRLTRHLLDAGHRVVATDGSSAMLDVAREYVPEAEDVRRVVLPDDPLPSADAIVSVGHVLNYLPDEDAMGRALVAGARALRPGGVLALDVCDLAWGENRRDAPTQIRMTDEWLIVTEYELPSANRFTRVITTFVRNEDGSWRRDDERHDNVLTDTSRLPAVLADHGVVATIASSFGGERLPAGLVVLTGHRPSG